MSRMVSADQSRDDLQLQIHIPHSMTSHYHLPMSQKPEVIDGNILTAQDSALEITYTPTLWCSQQLKEAPAKLLHQYCHCKGGEKSCTCILHLL